MKTTIQLFFVVITCIFFGCNAGDEDKFVVTSEFEDQEYIWLRIGNSINVDLL